MTLNVSGKRQTLLPYIIVIAVTAAIFMWPAPGGSGDSAEKETQPQAISVKTTKVLRDDLTDTFETTGTAESWAQVSVSPQLEGTLTQVEVETGTRVRSGQLLARLDDRILRADLKQAEAALVHTADDRLLRADLRRAETALAQSAAELTRIEQLVEKRLADQNRLQAAIAQKRLDEANLGKAENLLQAAITRKQIDEVGVERLQTLLSLSSLHSPIDGVIISERRYSGEAVQKGASLFSIADISRLRILTKVPEAIARKLRAGSGAVAKIDALSDREIPVSVRRIHPISDPASHQVTVELDAGSVFPTLQPGNLVTVAFTSDTRKRALILPRSAFPDVTQAMEIDVFRLRGDRAERSRVKLGLVLEERVEILSGLDEGDSVILGSGGLKDGDVVQVLEDVTSEADGK
jgi:HlyD family secretion protein